jgi:hypothetical protein
MVLEIKVNDAYQKEILTILENLKGVMIETVAQKEDDLGFLEEEIEKGFRSPMTNTTHSELFKRLKDKYV